MFLELASLAEVTGLPVHRRRHAAGSSASTPDLRAGFMRYVAASALLLVLFGVTLFIQQPASRMLHQLIRG